MRKPPEAATKHLSLRELGRADVSVEELQTVLREVLEAPDRHAAILISTTLESALDVRILNHLNIKDDDVIASLYERDAPLASFFGKIKLGYALGLYDATCRDNIDTVRRIRNAFAHARKPITFETPQVRNEVLKLELSDIDFAAAPARLRFLLGTNRLCIDLQRGVITQAQKKLRRISRLKRDVVQLQAELVKLTEDVSRMDGPTQMTAINRLSAELGRLQARWTKTKTLR